MCRWVVFEMLNISFTLRTLTSQGSGYKCHSVCIIISAVKLDWTFLLSHRLSDESSLLFTLSLYFARARNIDSTLSRIL